MLLFSRESPFVVDDAPVLNGIAIAAKVAEMALSLRAITNVVISRRGTCARAPAAAITEFGRCCADLEARPNGAIRRRSQAGSPKVRNAATVSAAERWWMARMPNARAPSTLGRLSSISTAWPGAKPPVRHTKS